MEQTNYQDYLEQVKECLESRDYIKAEHYLYRIIEESQEQNEINEARYLLLKIPKPIQNVDGEAQSLIQTITPRADLEFELE